MPIILTVEDRIVYDGVADTVADTEPQYERLGAWAGTALHYWPARNLTLVGLSVGMLCKLDSETTDDMGYPLVLDVQSGFEDYGTHARKSCDEAVFVFSRGDGDNDADDPPYANIMWRDKVGPWETRRVDLGRLGDTEPTAILSVLGVFRRRQWRIMMDADTRFMLASAQVSYTVLGGD